MTPNESSLPSLLSPLFAYPDGSTAQQLTAAAGHPASGAIKAHLTRFQSDTASLTAGDLEELYTKTFDLSPECVLHLGAQVFGEEENKRRLMLSKLGESFQALPDSVKRGELPDHISVVLGGWHLLGDEERLEFASFFMAPGLKAMKEILSKRHNPYRHLVEAAASACGLEAFDLTGTRSSS